MITPKSMVNGVTLTSSAATYYTVGSGTRAIIKKATFTNDDSSVITVNINLVPSAGSAGYANAISKAHPIAAGDTWICYEVENHELESGGFISMSASTPSKIGCRISGYEVIV